jgi:hypothetical protein
MIKDQSWYNHGIIMRTTPSHHADTPPTSRRQHASSRLSVPGGTEWAIGELAELRRLGVRRAGAEGFADGQGRGRKEEAKAKVPARV